MIMMEPFVETSRGRHPLQHGGPRRSRRRSSGGDYLPGLGDRPGLTTLASSSLVPCHMAKALPPRDQKVYGW